MVYSTRYREVCKKTTGAPMWTPNNRLLIMRTAMVLGSSGIRGPQLGPPPCLGAVSESWWNLVDSVLSLHAQSWHLHAYYLLTSDRRPSCSMP